MTRAYDAVVFDCDGVLVNSEVIAQRAILNVCTEFGLQFTHDEYARRFLGLSDVGFRREVNAESMRQTGTNVPEDFFEQIRISIGDAYQTELEAIDGIEPLLSSIHTPVAVASSSSKSALHFKLHSVGLAAYFEGNVFSGDDVPAAKPAPDLFLLAASQLGVNPANTVAIEDSQNGVISAKRAGMQVIGFFGGGHCPRSHESSLLSAGADHVFGSHAEIQDFLRAK